MLSFAVCLIFKSIFDGKTFFELDFDLLIWSLLPKVCLLQDLHVIYLVLPADVGNIMEASEMEMVVVLCDVRIAVQLLEP